MLIGAVIAVCVILFVLAILAPRLSPGPERASRGIFGLGGRGASKAPGALGRWLSKPFAKSSRAAGRSAAAGRTVRSKLPV